MNIKEIKEILDLLKNTNVDEFELERSNGKLRIKMSSAIPSVASGKPGASIEEVSPPLKAEQEAGNLNAITSPMVGTFYNAPSPEAQPFAEEGTVVKKGEVICIIEAMKLMNEVEAEFDCKIISILVENAQPVEYGASLFLVEPM